MWRSGKRVLQYVFLGVSRHFVGWRMEIQPRWTAGLGRVLRSPRVIAALLVACLVLGFVLTSVAAIPEVVLRDTRHFQGQVASFAEGRYALAVPEAAFAGVGFAEASTEGLECGVSIAFLTEAELRAFQNTGDVPPPQLHCGRTTARLPGSVAAVFVENQLQNASDWSFDLALFEVSYPYALLGLPAIGLLLAGGLGLPVLFLQRAIPRWVERLLTEEKKE